MSQHGFSCAAYPLLLPLMFALLLYALREWRGWGVFAAFVCLAVQLRFCAAIPSLTDLCFLFLCDGALLIFCARSGWFGLGRKLEMLLTILPFARLYCVRSRSRCALVFAAARSRA